MKSKPRNSKGSKKSGRNNPAIDNPIKPIHSKLQDNAHQDPTAISRDRVMQYKALVPHEVPAPLPNQTTNGIEYPRFDRRPPTTSMETEFIEALYSDLSGRTSCSPSINTNPILDSAYTVHSDLDLPPHSSSESDDIDSEDMESYDEDRGEDGNSEDFDDDLDVYGHDDFLSSQEAILMELRREQVEFEENVRQLQQQLQRQGSLLPLSSNDGDEFESIAQSNVYSDYIDATGDSNNIAHEIDGGKIEHGIGSAIGLFPGPNYVCNSCKDPKSSLCLENYGSIWRIAIIEALATAAATIASFNAYQYQQDQDRNDESSIDQTKFRYFEFLPRPRPPNRPRDTLEHQYDLRSLKSNDATDGEAVLSDRRMDPGHRTSQATSIRHMYQDMTPPSPAIRYPLPPNSPYKFGRKSSEFLEPVGEFHEFQSAEGNSRQVLLHVWPPSSQDAPLLQRLEACCRDFQENDVVRGHSGDGFLNGWRPSWKQPHQTGVLRFGHWRVRAPSSQGMRLYPPFQTPLTLAAGGGSVLWSNINNANESASSDHESNIDPLSNLDNTEQSRQQRSRAYSAQQQETQGQQQKQQQSCPVQESSSSLSGNKKSRMTEDVVPESQPNLCEHGTSCGIDELVDDYNDQGQGLSDVHVDSCTQGRLLRLIRAIQMVEKTIIARHLKYLFPTLYEKYHGLQFGTPRLFDAVATVALAMDVSPRLHHDKAHTKHGFCWIVACGDFVGGDLCIPELGKRVVMRPGTVVAIRSTVVAYYVERYAKNTSMFTMYGYTSDNNWPPTA